MSRSQVPSTWQHAGFFQLRTPLHPLDALLAFTADPAPLHERLRGFLARGGMREALQLASPALLARVDRAYAGADRGDEGIPADLSATLYRFIARSCGRATPFGLFAGTSTGSVARTHALQLAAREHWRRHSTLDAAYAHHLATVLGMCLGRQLEVHVNPRSFEAGDRIRYLAASETAHGTAFALVGMAPDAPLRAAIACASKGARIDEVCSAVAAVLDPGVGARDIEDYVHELVRMDLLVPELEPPLTGRDAFDALDALASTLPDDVAAPGSTAVALDWRERIARARARRDDADQLRIDEPSLLSQELAEAFAQHAEPDGIAGAGARADLDVGNATHASANEAARPQALLQVDLHTRLVHGTLGEPVTHALHAATLVLQRLYRSRGSHALAHFRARFEARYGSREVPLLEALDDEIGIVFDGANNPNDDASPLLDGLGFPAPSAAVLTLGPAEQFLLPRAAEALRTGTRILRIDDADLEHWERTHALPPCTPLPDAFTVLATLHAEDDAAVNAGRFDVQHLGAGAQGAALLGRFCHGDATLHGHVRRWLASEQALHPQAEFAEIVYRPGIRLANVARRPLLRDHEIPVVGRSGAPLERQLPLADLRVSIVDGRVRLRSQRLDREVLPRHGSALDAQRPGTPGLVRFLAALAQQEGVGVKFAWGALAAMPVLPRVVHHNVVLAPARWRLDGADLAPLRGAARADTRARAIAHMLALRARLQLPRLVGLCGPADAAADDAPLPLDLDCDVAIEVLAAHAHTGALLVEWFPSAAGGGGIPGADGRHAHEFVVPYLRTPAPTDAQGRMGGTRASALARSPASGPFTDLPEDDPCWHYVKLYGSRADADRLLAEGVAPFVAGAMQDGTADGWFFLRYEDPEPHIRLRLHATADMHVDALQARLRAAASAWTRAGWIHSMRSDIYQPEYTRFGGAMGMRRAEALFQADSDAVLVLLREQPAADERWLHAAAGAWHLLLDAGMDAPARLALLTAMEADFAQEFGADSGLRARIGARHRAWRTVLAAVLDVPAPAWIAGRSARSRALLRSIAAGMGHDADRHASPADMAPDAHASAQAGFAAVLRTFLHLHVNRMCRSSARAHEFVIVSLLARHARSAVARTGSTGNPPA